MKNFVRRIAVVIGAVALSAGLIGATAVPAHARRRLARRPGPRLPVAGLIQHLRLETRTRLPPTCLVLAPTPQARLNSTRAVTAGRCPRDISSDAHGTPEEAPAG